MRKSIAAIIVALFIQSAHGAVADSSMELAEWSPPPAQVPPHEPSIEQLMPALDSNKEVAAAINGRAYTVLTPIFTGADNNYSFIRFPNGGTTTATFYVKVMGSPTAHSYGTAVVRVAPFASPQYSITEIFNAIGLSGFSPGDDSYSLYLSSPQGGYGAAFQHVVWNSLTGFFENASLCTYKPSIDYSALNYSAINVHTSRIPAYPGIIFLHNYAAFPVTYLASVFDSVNGSYLGAVYFNMGANETHSINFSDLEFTLGFSPSPSQYHANILFQALDTGGQYYAIAAHAINNLQLNALTNMSVGCAVNPS